jgi:glycosyltransferase 2 family protein
MPPEPESSAQLFGKTLVRKMLAPVVLAVVVYAALLLYGDARSVFGTMKHAHPAPLATGVALSLASLALRGVRWHLYLAAARISVPIVDAALAFCTGLAMTITPAKAGELLKSLLLKERYDVPVARSAPIIVAERLTDLAALLLLGGVSLAGPRYPVVTALASALCIGALYAFGRWRRFGSFVIALATKLPVLRRRREKLLDAHAALHELWGARSFAAALGIALVAWSLQGLSVLVFAEDLAGVGISVATALIAYAAPLLAGALAFLPGGLGLTEASMAQTLATLAPMSTSDAVAVTLLTRLATFWLAVLIGFLALAAWKGRKRTVAVQPAVAAPTLGDER